MQVLQTPTFTKAVKKLHAHQKRELDKAVRTLVENPLIGELKRRSEFSARLQIQDGQATDPAWLPLRWRLDRADPDGIGSHEKFYRDIKR